MKSLLISLLAITGLLFPVGVAAQSTPQLSIPVNTVIRGDQGSEHLLGEVDVDEEYVGMTCEVIATAKNQTSIHPGNDIVVSSNGSSVTLENVERESNGLTEATDDLVLGDKVSATLVMGEDKVFSGGLNVEFHCEKTPEEEPKIEVCRDNKVITIKESERLSTDTDAPCPEVLPTVTTLPKTGVAESIIGLVVGGVAILGTVAHSAFQRR